MKILVNINNNIAKPKSIKSFKVFDLGEVVTTVDDLLQSSIIEIDDQILPILKITNENEVIHYLINDLGLTFGSNQSYYTDDFTKEITINDLVLINNGEAGEINIQSDWNQLNTLADDYIKNKPTLLSDFINDIEYITSNQDLSLAIRKNDILYGIIDQYTGEDIQLKLINYIPYLVDNIIFFQLEGEYFKRVFKEINIEWFGAIEGGVIDNTLQFQKALDYLLLNGGEIVIPAKTFLIEGQLIIPDNLEEIDPKMSSTILRGSGANHTGRGGEPFGGTILDLRYDGTYGKIIGLGLGFLKIENISFVDFGISSTNFIYTNYPTLHIKDCSFYGNKSASLSDQDGIILGGFDDIEGNRGLNSGFQGYGTIIEGNYFSRIRRAIYGRTYFNGNIIQNNTIWSTCGTNDENIGAIEIDGGPQNVSTQKSTGNIISGNLIEATNYKYCIVLRETEKNTLLGNNFYDEIGITESYYKLDPTAQYNYILAGFNNNLIDFINESALINNTIIINHQNQISNYPEKQMFRNDVIIKPDSGSSSAKSTVLINNLLTEVYYRLEVNDRITFYKKIEGESEEKLFTVKDFGGGVITQYLEGTDCRIESLDKLRIRTNGAGSELYLGNNIGGHIFLIDGRIYSILTDGTQPFRILSKTPVENLTVERLKSGSIIAENESDIIGIKIFTGTGIPEGIITAVVGSIYLRKDGGTNTTMYVKESGTGDTGWIPK